jgi:C-terminal processing protease CtpA/Prc
VRTTAGKGVVDIRNNNGGFGTLALDVLARAAAA